MPLPHDGDHDETLVRYLLGLLPEEDAERLDADSIIDDDVAARLRTVETDLIDSYVRGKLSGEQLQRFESHYLASPRRREHVRLAASFVGAIDRSASRDEWVTRTHLLRRPAVLVQVVAAALLVIVAGGLLLFEGTTREPGRTTSKRAAPSLVQPPRKSAGEGAAAALPAPSPPAGERAPRRAGAVAIVLLPPTRTATPVPVVTVPEDADHVSFELRLEASDFPRYRVALENPVTKHVLWRSGWTTPQTSVDQPSVPVAVPAALLEPRHHVLNLAGHGDDLREEVIGSYTFRVVRPF